MTVTAWQIFRFNASMGLRPAGRAIIAVPFHSQGFREIYRSVDDSFRRHDEPVFYERHYDLPSVRSRLVKPAGLFVRKSRTAQCRTSSDAPDG